MESVNLCAEAQEARRAYKQRIMMSVHPSPYLPFYPSFIGAGQPKGLTDGIAKCFCLSSVDYELLGIARRIDDLFRLACLVDELKTLTPQRKTTSLVRPIEVFINFFDHQCRVKGPEWLRSDKIKSFL